MYTLGICLHNDHHFMSKTDEQMKLTALFKRLGAPEPEEWASSQLNEGIPQLHRFLFLRQAWRHVVNEDDASWIDAWVEDANRRPDDPYAGVGHALKRLRETGAADADILDIVRGVQAEFLFTICYLLGDPNIEEPEAQHINWGLFSTDDEGAPIESIDSLHEDVLGTDPTGREMRPRRR